MATLQTSGLKLKYEQRTGDRRTSAAEIPEGKVTMIVGANACGKSTLLRGLARLLKPAAGTVTAGRQGHPQHVPAREVARTLGLLPQHPTGAGRHHCTGTLWAAAATRTRASSGPGRQAGRGRAVQQAIGRHRNAGTRRAERRRTLRRPAAAGLDRDGPGPGNRRAAAG